MYSTVLRTNFIVSVISILSSVNAFDLDKRKILLFDKELTLYSIDTHFNTSTIDSFLKTSWEKKKIARNKQFLLFPQCFLRNQKIVSSFVNIFDITSLFAAELEDPKIGISGNGLTQYHQTRFYDP